MEENQNILSLRIKKLRTDAGLTQEELAMKLGLKGKSSIANYESGKITPSDEIKIKLCKLFECSIDYLMGNSEYKNEAILGETLLASYEVDKHVFNSFNILIEANLPLQRIKLIINNFNYYCNYTINQLNLYSKGMYFNEDKKITNFTDAKNKNYFLSIHNSLIDVLVNAKTISIATKEKPLFLVNTINYSINNSTINKIISLINLFQNILNTFYQTYKESKTQLSNINSTSNKFYMCPVYGRISAGQPNWAEECIEGRIPIDPDLMNITEPEECFFLRVNGESMNKEIKNGAYALIRKTDVVENGDIAVVLVNGYDATLKKFSKQGDLIILEPLSNDPSFTTQVYGKDTEIKIIGKYIGKMEMK